MTHRVHPVLYSVRLMAVPSDPCKLGEERKPDTETTKGTEGTEKARLWASGETPTRRSQRHGAHTERTRSPRPPFLAPPPLEAASPKNHLWATRSKNIMAQAYSTVNINYKVLFECLWISSLRTQPAWRSLF